ncbi:DNA repair protein RAD51 homolog 4 [Aplysia californica]|uniref:DNA repair protein RAD51 homolog 4 n=1 Tax=Aplysia californica TaxID=6500 RepID=A0ABM0ZYQ8_APLCA|nr:DNA repair protein RAD51 homolog 4 [Aplysia californica]
MALLPGLCTALTQETWQKLQDASIKTVTDFISKDPELLSQRLHLPYKDLCSIQRVLLAEHAAYPVSAALLYNGALTTFATLSTGYDRLDDLLDGGLYTGEVTEFAGDCAAGKTTICHAASATTISTDGQSVLYIDTVCSLSPQSIAECLLKTHTDTCPDEQTLHSCLKKMRSVQAFDVWELFAVLKDLASKLAEGSSDTRDLKLIIVDSLVPVIYSVAGGVQQAQGYLSEIGLRLKQLAVTFSLAVVVTNNLVSDFGGSGRIAALGKLWSHLLHTRVILERCEDPTVLSGTRTALLVKSCRQKSPSSVVFSLG